MVAPYPYGDPPPWWGKGNEAAGQAARDAIALSVRVGARMRAIAGKNSVVGMDAQIPGIFPDLTERAEAYRLLWISSLSKRKERHGDNRVDGHLGQATLDEGSSVGGGSADGETAQPAGCEGGDCTPEDVK